MPCSYCLQPVASEVHPCEGQLQQLVTLLALSENLLRVGAVVFVDNLPNTLMMEKTGGS